MIFLKQIVAAFAISAILAAATSLPVFASIFSDVASDHENVTAIDYLKENGYIDGYADNTFKPAQEITRAEAVKVLVSGIKLPLSTTQTVLFSDVLATDWFFPHVMTAKEAGIVSGDDSGLFRPGDTISLAEGMKILAESFEVNLPTFSETYGNIYSDVHSSDWFAQYFAYAKEKNILLMDDHGNVYPYKPLTRAQFAELMYRFIYVKDHGNEDYPLDDVWLTYESKEIPFIVKYPSDFDILVYEGAALDEVIFWKGDSRFFQFSPDRTYPNTAKFAVSLDQNVTEMSKDEYFANIRQVFGSGVIAETTFEGFPAMIVSYDSSFIKDYYIYLNSGNFSGKALVVYSSAGSGVVATQQRKILDEMLDNFQYNEIVIDENYVDYTKVKSEIFKNVLVEGEGQDMLDLLPDEYIVETDTIGVGTGPVDYYYSVEIDMTLKYERNGDVILDTRDGNTTAF